MSEKWIIGYSIKDRYQIHAVKKGGMGIVFLCYDVVDKQPVAIKTFQDKFIMDNAMVARFIDEVALWIQLGEHENIVTAYDVCLIHRRPYIFLEYIAGDTVCGAELQEWIAHKRLDVTECVTLALQFCAGMIYAGEVFAKTGRTFVHCDIKPSNIFVTQEKVLKISDFGLSATWAPNSSNTGWGSLEYLPPERFFLEGHELKTYSDIYAFGCVLYCMVCGRPPFYTPNPDGEARMAYYRENHLHQTPAAPMEINSACPPELSGVIMQCLAKEPRERPEDFRALKEDLAGIYTKLTGRQSEAPRRSTAGSVKIRLNRKGIALTELGKFDEAIACLTEALENKNDPEYDPTLYCNRGRAYSGIQDYDRAMADFQKSIELDGASAIAYNSIGNIHTNRGEWQPAIEAYNQSIAIEPEHGHVYYNRGIGFMRQERFEEAIRDYSKAISLGFTFAYSNRGIIYGAQGELEKALFDFDKAIEVNPRDAIAYAYRGQVHQDSGEYEKARSDFDTAIKLNPYYKDAYCNRAELYYEMGEYEKAVEEYQDVLAMDPLDTGKIFGTAYDLSDLQLRKLHAKSYYICGLAYIKLSRLNEATSCFEEFLRIAPAEFGDECKKAREVLKWIQQHA
jgi:tetratricopeptide (TPR) repeat protein